MIQRWRLIGLCWLALAAPALAGNLHIHEAPVSDSVMKTELTIYGSADHPAILPVFLAFQQKHPTVTIRYTEFSTRGLYHYFLNHPDKRPDLVLSPAMDLQIKLVNDGYAQRYHSSQTENIPDWARWRDEVFGFTFEPIVIAMNKTILDGAELPQSRTQLIDLIRMKGDEINGRIGLSDIETVGLGYLTWSHDSQQSRSYGRLLEIFGSHKARFYPNSTAMLKALARGEIVIAYNVLGSYAQEWADQHPDLAVIMPSDYTTVLMRSAFIPKAAVNKQDAELFLDFLLSEQGQQVLADQSSLNPIAEQITGPHSISQLRKTSHGPLQPIPLDLELLLLTDDAKRQLLLNEWHSAMKQNSVMPFQ